MDFFIKHAGNVEEQIDLLRYEKYNGEEWKSIPPSEFRECSHQHTSSREKPRFDNALYKIKMKASYTLEDVVADSGSKYIDSNNLENIFDVIECGKRYCFVGKPCEVSTLRRYSNINPRIDDSILYYLSFFCAGVPSIDANKKLVESLGCKPNECESIVYRGNGWPGKTIVKDKTGKEYKSDYENSWMNYLGRDTRKICRFCIDGVGELADISCGDAWYLIDDKPIFNEKNGRNVLFVRSGKGKDLFDRLVKSNQIKIETINDLDDYLKHSNPYQYTRRTTLYSMIFALKLLRKPYPNYKKSVLRGCASYLPKKYRIRRVVGTIVRIIKRKI